MSMNPETFEVSVVVAAFSGEAALHRCLQSLQAQHRETPPEIIVATSAATDKINRWSASFPSVRFIHGRPGANVFELRSLGVTQAHGRLIVLTEDHCTVNPGWLAAFEAACCDDHPIVGGPVENGLNDGAYNQALYFCEYGLYLPPLPAGPAAALSGVNIAYRRDVLLSCRPVWQSEFRENEVHDALRHAGHHLYMENAAGVKSHIGFSLREAIAHLSHGGFHYGSYRTGDVRAPLRIFRAMIAPMMPFLLLARIFRHVTTRQPPRLWPMCRSLPYLLCLLTAWSAGEAVGYLRPRGGRIKPSHDRSVERQTEGA